MDHTIKTSQFFDDEGRLTKLPKKFPVRMIVLEYLAEKFEFDRIYTEREVNEICGRWHTFNDFFLLRRELVDYHFLRRERDGSKYWREHRETE